MYIKSEGEEVLPNSHFFHYLCMDMEHCCYFVLERSITMKREKSEMNMTPKFCIENKNVNLY